MPSVSAKRKQQRIRSEVVGAAGPVVGPDPKMITRPGPQLRVVTTDDEDNPTRAKRILNLLGSGVTVRQTANSTGSTIGAVKLVGTGGGLRYDEATDQMGTPEDTEFSDDAEDFGWQDRALCAQTDPEAFFPEKGGSTREAKKVCRSCEVRLECLQYALEHNERFGIWGGLAERERRRLMRVAS